MKKPTPQQDKILKRVRASIAGIFGARLDKIILYGSRARGAARRNSDYDIAIFLKNYRDRFAEFDKIKPVQADIWEETGLLVSPLVFRTSDYGKQTGLMHVIRSEGVTL